MDSPSSATEPVLPPTCVAAPLLKALLPLMAGIIAAHLGCPPLLVAILPAPLIVALHAARAVPMGHYPPWVTAAAFLAGFVLMRMEIKPPPPEWSLQPPREARITFELRELFNARKPGHIAGIGVVRQVDPQAAAATGHKLAFYLNREAIGDRPLLPGQILSGRGVLTFLPFLEAPDDYQAYLLRRHVYLSAGQGHIRQAGKGPPFLESLRNKLYRSSQYILGGKPTSEDNTGNVLASMILGDRSLLSDERIELYRNTGAYHLFAVSGLHVGSVALSLFLLGRLLRIRRTRLLLPVLAATWGYVWLTGASPSAVRAGIMLSCLGLARICFRQAHLFPALVASAWLVLLIQPAQLFHLGFQLSYTVVASILLIGIPLSRKLKAAPDIHSMRFPRPGKAKTFALKAVRRGIDLSAISLSASLASMPLIVEHFDLFTPGGLLLGILLNPLATFATMAGFQSLFLSPLIGEPTAALLSRISWPAIDTMEWLLRGCLAVPGAVQTRTWPVPGMGTALLLAVLSLAWILQRRGMGRRSHSLAGILLAPGLLAAALAFATVEP